MCIRDRTYTITVKDQYGITSTCTVEVPGPNSALDIDVDNVDDATCNGGDDGKITVSGSGGTSPYQFSLNGGPFQTSGMFPGLEAGNYTVEVRDANGCTETTGVVTVGQPGNSLSCTVSCNPDSETVQCDAGDNIANMNAWNAANISKLEGCITGCINNNFEVTSNYNASNLSDLCGSSGAITVTYTITDECGKSETKQATYTITDNTPPTVACDPDDSMTECAASSNRSAADAWNAANIAKLEGCSSDDCSQNNVTCLLDTSPCPRDATLSRMPSSA